VTRARARNFYYAFVLLDGPRRDAICAIYAFMRRCDDLADEPGATPAAIEQWRAELRRALVGEPTASPVWPAFAATAHRYRIPEQYFHDMIDGTGSDLTRPRMESFEDLYRYCYQVASVAGLSLIHVLGFRDPAALRHAEECGIAFQLTNILRDVREDARHGRVYLPATDAARFGVDTGALAGGPEPAGLRDLLRFEATRAREYFARSRPLLDMVSPECRASLWALIEIYSRLLTRIEQSGFDVLPRRIRLSTAEKLWILARGALGWTS
jgi:phytoene synthase